MTVTITAVAISGMEVKKTDMKVIVRSVLEKHPDVVAYADLPDRGSTIATLEMEGLAE